jgi:hypothetical protein
MRTNIMTSVFMRRSATLLAMTASIVAVSSCDEKLPSGPATFPAQLEIVVPHDTIVVGDSAAVQARATDVFGHLIQRLTFGWSSGDSGVVSFATASDSDAVTGRAQTIVGKRTGNAALTLTLSDSRFVVANASKNETVVVGGVKALTSHDSTLTAVNDTGVAIAEGMVRANGALVPRASQGIHWTHLGQHTTVIGTGDTIRYVARSNGADTLIASHDFCLATAKCADTVVARVSQQLTLTLSVHTLAAWSFSDSLAPTVTLADRRGNGLPGASVRFVPATTGDSTIVRVVGPFASGDPVSGKLATPQLVSIANGTAKVRVFAVAADNHSIVAVDSVIETVRQVARHVGVEPLRAVITSVDSVPIKAVARDARGVPIGDADLTVSALNVPLHGIWAGPTSAVTTSVLGSISAAITGVALPDSNPSAPQVPVAFDASLITVVRVDTVKAGATQQLVGVAAFDSIGRPAVNQWIRFGASFGPVPDSVQLDATGSATAIWFPRDSVGTYTLTALRGTSAPVATLADSAGRVMLRRTVVVTFADSAAASRSTLQTSKTSLVGTDTATITVILKDRFGNTVKNVTTSQFSLTPTAGSIATPVCDEGVCKAIYTAPGASATVNITLTVNGTALPTGPITITTTP